MTRSCPNPKCKRPVYVSDSEVLSEAAKISRGRAGKTGRKPKLSPCKFCGQEYGVVEMRSHRPKCGKFHQKEEMLKCKA